jgi:hypothetical protein
VAAGSEERGSAGDITLVHIAQAGGTQGLGLDSGPAPPELQSNPARAMARAMPSTATTPMPSTELLWLPEGPSSKAGSFEPAGSLAEEPEPRTKAGQARSGNILLGRNLGPCHFGESPGRLQVGLQTIVTLESSYARMIEMSRQSQPPNVAEGRDDVPLHCRKQLTR